MGTEWTARWLEAAECRSAFRQWARTPPQPEAGNAEKARWVVFPKKNMGL